MGEEEWSKCIFRGFKAGGFVMNIDLINIDLHK